MKRHIENILAYLLLITISLSVTMIFASVSYSQRQDLPRIGTTLSEVRTNIERGDFPLEKWINDDNIHIENKFLSVLYTFEEKELDRIHLVREYERRNLAISGLDGYLTYLDRLQAVVIPLVVEDEVEIYSAFTDDAIYDLHMSSDNNGHHELTVTIQARLQNTPAEQLSMR